MRLLLVQLFFNHIMGTLYMGVVLLRPYNNWMITYGIIDNSWASKYNYSVYFAVSVTTMAVLGDVRPVNNIEIVLTWMMMIYGVLFLSYNIYQATSIFTNLLEARYQLQK